MDTHYSERLSARVCTQANAFRSLFNENERREVLSMAILFSILDLAPIVGKNND